MVVGMEKAREIVESSEDNIDAYFIYVDENNEVKELGVGEIY
jgi:hypothetical protein